VVDAPPAHARIADPLAKQPDQLGEAGAGLGSNSWVVSGAHTTTGKPLLANDPHLGPSMPGIWYQVGLHCRCGIELTGFSFSGVPGVIIGHNGRVAWGFTNLGPDVTDLYLEMVDGDRYFDGTAWRPLATRQEVIRVAGADPVTITVRATPHGPLLSDRLQDALTIAARPPVDASGSPLPRVPTEPSPSLDPTAPDVPAAARTSPYAVALRWTALDPNATMEALFAVNRAVDGESFRAGAALFTVPAQNLLYADVDGNIGYQAPGQIPIRGAGDGTWPVPGWDPAYDWQGYIPFGELPSVTNPEEGWIVTANQAVVGPDYPYLITRDWDYGYRSQRLVELLTDRLADGPVDIAAYRQLQFDNHNSFAPTLVDAVRDLRGDPAFARVPAGAVDLLLGWDFQQDADSAAAALFNVLWRNLLARTFDELPDDRAPGPGPRWWMVVGDLLEQPDSPWWDVAETPEVEHLADTLGTALADAVAELESRQGDDPAGWRWGELHTLTLTNATFGVSGIAPIEWLFNRGPEGTSGGDATVNATSWDPRVGYQVRWVPSMRMIVDMSNMDGSRWIQLTGNSGHAFHSNYDDQFPLWRVGHDLPMRWNRSSIEQAATHTLTLHP
jgi:penicillin amidase